MKLDFLKKYDFFVGVPDSQLKPLCNYLINEYGISKNHIIAANEGNACAIAAGYYLATQKVPVVYMQNSGEGNAINPIASLMNDKVYGIPCVFVVGWRGEPGVHDEPQHVFQGEITTKLLDDLDIRYFIIDKDTNDEDILAVQKEFDSILKSGKQVAYIIKKDALVYKESVKYSNNYILKREDVIELITKYSQNDIIVSTTGKTSRELFEIRERNNDNHFKDFLTVGSMGHSSSIALGIALQKPDKRIWIIDGDGAALMHLGAMAVIGANNPKNIIHVLINNEAHESVGGMPTVAKNIDFCKIASGCRYKNVYTIDNIKDLTSVLVKVSKNSGLTFIEIKTAIGSRNNLGRPTISPHNNMLDFIENIV